MARCDDSLFWLVMALLVAFLAGFAYQGGKIGGALCLSLFVIVFGLRSAAHVVGGYAVAKGKR